MDTIEVNAEAAELSVGPGARFLDIHRVLKKHGLALLSMTSGKGGTFIGWMSTGGLGFGSFHHGPVRNQLLSIRVVLPDGTLKELEARRPGNREIPLHRRSDGRHRKGKDQSRERTVSVFPVCHSLREGRGGLYLCKKGRLPFLSPARGPGGLPLRIDPGP